MSGPRTVAGDQLLLGVDLGTSSIKAVLATPAGEVVASASRRVQVAFPRPRRAEMDADDWWTEVCALMRELAAGVDAGAIAGVCVSGLGPCLVLVDGDGRPTRPAILYGIDMRAGEEIAELTDRLGADAILERCGKALSTQAVGPKLVWVARHEPEVWAQSRRWHSSHSWIVERLTGEYVLDHHTASQNDPLYDLRAHAWYEPWAQEIAGHLERPRLAWPGDLVGEVSAAASAHCGLPAGTPVCAGTVDAWAESVCAGVVEPGELMLMYGSTMFFVAVTDSPAARDGLWTTTGVMPGSYTLAAGMATSGILVDWVRELCGEAPFDELIAEARAVPRGSDGLVLLPYFAGERSPIFDPHARGVIAGLTLGHRRGHLFRAAYEGIAYGIRQILDVLAAAAGPPTRIVAVGGGTQGGLWTQIVTDVTGCAQSIPRETIGACYGDALLAARATGLTDVHSWAQEERRIEPDPAARATYDECFAVYCDLYPTLAPQLHRLAALQERGA